ncbi:glycine-rich RNA-binding protein 7-like [Vicia villosa]|uniref:glycine-rich RNA-binding protein 7-like n=1 Tax=Vicia villosa TaxID=3911 RepID=UPI00273AEC49|nr:glycine-rich RNA-binding protein 7-like [Vicia villosa]
MPDAMVASDSKKVGSSEEGSVAAAQTKKVAPRASREVLIGLPAAATQRGGGGSKSFEGGAYRSVGGSSHGGCSRGIAGGGVSRSFGGGSRSVGGGGSRSID